MNSKRKDVKTYALMKLILIFTWVVILIGCEKNDIVRESDFKESTRALKDFKESKGNSYQYTSSGSSWSGNSWKTEIIVEKGEVTGRKFYFTHYARVTRPASGWTESEISQVLDELNTTEEEFLANNGKNLRDVLEWEEGKEGLNSHRNSSPATSPVTLDQIYAKAQSDWLLTRNDATTYLETANDGLISLCGYVENGCMDDCFIGIHIDSIVGL